MMKPSNSYNLKGEFKVDIYNKAGEVVETTDFFSNFITATGLYHPLTYAFADCFKYLSLGQSNKSNFGEVVGKDSADTPTTGLYSPISTIYTNSGTQFGTYIGFEGISTGDGINLGSCTTISSPTGPIFYRGWQIPTGQDTFISGFPTPASGLSISEFMVSPSTGGHPTGKYAFSRVLRDIVIPHDHRAIISYRLSVRLKNTGISHFSSGTFTTGNADTSQDFDIVKDWQNLSGYYRQVYHGLRCVDAMGFTYIPKWGDIMEPSRKDLKNSIMYLSPDISQFDVNWTGANNGNYKWGYQSNETGAYKADGLTEYSYGHDMFGEDGFSRDYADQLPSEIAILYNSGITDDTQTVNNLPDETSYNILPKDIRLGGDGGTASVPNVNAYHKQAGSATGAIDINYRKYNFDMHSQAKSVATPGGSGYDPAYIKLGTKAAFSSRSVKLPFYTGYTGRTKGITRQIFFPPAVSMGKNARVGSMVYSFRRPDNTYYPTMDCLFFDSSGRSLMQHYRKYSGMCATQRGSGILRAYLYAEPSGCGKFNVKTIQGPYSTTLNHPALLDDVDPYQPAKMAIKSTCGESLNTGAYGNTGINNGIVPSGYYEGWGSFYGNFAPSGFDYGLVDHSLTANTPPNNTGDIYWPNVPPNGGKIYLKVSGVTYYHPSGGIGIVPDFSGYFGLWPKNQVARDIYFEAESTLLSGIPYSPLSGMKNFVEQTTGYAKNTGFFFTTGKYNIFDGSSGIASSGSLAPTQTGANYFYTRETGIIAGQSATLRWKGAGKDGTTFDGPKYAVHPFVTYDPFENGYISFGDTSSVEQTIVVTPVATTTYSFFPLGDDYYNSGDGSYVTVYVDQSTNNNPLIETSTNVKVTGYLIPYNYNSFVSGTTLLTDLTGVTGKIKFTPTIQASTVKINGYDVTGYRMVKMFNDLEQRGSGYNLNDDTKRIAIFTGLDSAGKGLYLTYVESNNTSWNLWSTLSGMADMTKFVPPSGVIYHEEAFRLLPGYGYPSCDPNPLYYPVTGGHYPALSFDNGIDMFLDIKWSAPCGSALNCNEQSL